MKKLLVVLMLAVATQSVNAETHYYHFASAHFQGLEDGEVSNPTEGKSTISFDDSNGEIKLNFQGVDIMWIISSVDYDDDAKMIYHKAIEINTQKQWLISIHLNDGSPIVSLFPFESDKILVLFN